jgi:hypothetical protein
VVEREIVIDIAKATEEVVTVVKLRQPGALHVLK